MYDEYDEKRIEQRRTVPDELIRKVGEFIDAEWIEPPTLDDACMDHMPCVGSSEKLSRSVRSYQKRYAPPGAPMSESFEGVGMATTNDLDEIIGPLGQTFQEKLLATIDAKGLKDSEVYSKANIDRRLFSKIRSNKNYKPSKPTALAFAIALGLNLDETTDLLQRAGLALSPSSKSDLIVKYCILNGIYDILDVNAILYEYDQPLLGY